MRKLAQVYELGMQTVLGLNLFDTPGLKPLKNLWYNRRYHGRSVKIGPQVLIAAVHPKKCERDITIGEDSIICYRTYIDYTGGLSIGRHVNISQETLIFTHEHSAQMSLFDPRNKDPINKKLVIEDEVWIGARAIILPSVHRIGKGAMVGAGSVVTKDIEDYTIVAGNPATVIGTRTLS